MAKPRVYHQGGSIVVIGTSDAHEACAAAGIHPDSHRWGSTSFGLFVRRKGEWESRSDLPPVPKDAREGVMFWGPIVERGTRLDADQLRALQAVARGEVEGVSRARRHGMNYTSPGACQPRKRAPFDWLAQYGLISVAPHVRQRHTITVTPKGQAYLDQEALA